MNQTQSFSLLGKVLNVEGFAVGENGVTLTLEQMQAVENALADRDRSNAELTEQVAALKAAPAEKSQSVVEDKSQHEADNPFAQFANKVNNARQMYNQVP